jgi:hypothetical protein
MPIPIAAVAPLNGWRQIGSPNWMKPAMHTFEKTRDGQLEHRTDGVLRAVVPPEGWDDYVALWPEAAPLVEQLQTRAPRTHY